MGSVMDEYKLIRERKADAHHLTQPFQRGHCRLPQCRKVKFWCVFFFVTAATLKDSFNQMFVYDV